jgi:uncharacterized protein YnzC (UPF0291/DUF896 family)
MRATLSARDGKKELKAIYHIYNNRIKYMTEESTREDQMLRKQFIGIAKTMKAQFENITTGIPHSGERGASREEQVRKFLRERLPKRFSIGNGEVVATTQEISLQQDVIIYDAFYCPLLYSSETSQIFPSESVIAAMEVKSSLNNVELEDCIKKIESVKKLPKLPGVLSISPTAKSMGQTYPTFGTVFAFSSAIKSQTLLSDLNELEKQIPLEHRIDLVCVLDSYLIANISPDRKILTGVTNTSKRAIVYSGEDSLFLFYLLLMDTLNNRAVAPPNLMLYGEAYALSFNVEY